MSPASRLDALLCVCVRPGRHLYQHVNVSGGCVWGCALSCSFDAINPTQKCLHTQSCRMFFPRIRTWKPSPVRLRIIRRSSLFPCWDVWPRSPSNMDEASWGQPGCDGRLRSATNTASGGHFYCFSFHFPWHLKNHTEFISHRPFFPPLATF